VSTLTSIRRLVTPYFSAADRAPIKTGPVVLGTVAEKLLGRALLAAVIVAELIQVWLAVLVNQWNVRFYNALQERNPGVFWHEVGVFSAIAAAFIAVAVYQLYLNQWLQIRWRRWLTRRYCDRWLEGGTHYRMRLTGDPADNPDQRIADDLAFFVDSTLTLGVGVLSSVVRLASFAVILWGISEQAPLLIAGRTYAIPGHLVWIAAGFAILGTLGAHFIGRPLVGLNFRQQRFEADFRFALVRLRENSEQVALLGGEPAERVLLGRRVARVVANWYSIMRSQKWLTFFTSGYTQTAIVLPFIVISPSFFAGVIQLGVLMQAAGAFVQVQSAFSFFVTAYAQIAQWRAVVDRLDGFERHTALAKDARIPRTSISTPAPTAMRLSLQDVYIELPDGTPLVTGLNLDLAAGEAVLLIGPSGSGKTTLFRTLAGFWPRASGRIALAPGARVLILPQRPYLPLGPLRAILAYPSPEATLRDAEALQVLKSVGLSALAARLNEHGAWSDRLSLGEQQRLGFARALLVQPDVLLLDEATSALDEAAEADLYRLLRTALPDAAILSVGHRSSLRPLHDRCIDLAADGAGARTTAQPSATAGHSQIQMRPQTLLGGIHDPRTRVRWFHI
jgi:putative ATP-binding cassette transporter